MKVSVAYINKVLEKCYYFRDTQILPLVDTFNPEQWLDNFDGEEERYIAAHILDYFIYIPEKMIDRMLAVVLGKCGNFFQKSNKTWSDADFINNCWYSYIPGEDHGFSASGVTFVRQVRTLFNIPTNRLLSYDQLMKKMRETHNEYFILVDDFIGSGHQVEDAWCSMHFTDGKHMSLAEICEKHYHKVVYAPLIVNTVGYEHLQETCSTLHIEYVHLLPREFSLLHPQCPCWNGDNELYTKAMAMIKEKSEALGISDTKGLQTTDMYGYRQQGLALAFKHGMPDASLPLFTKETLEWKPLIKYQH